MMFAAVRVRGQLFAAIFQPPHGMAAPHGEPAQTDFFSRNNCLIAEAATNIGGNDANLNFGNLQGPGKTGTYHVRKL